jgi:hypothetical protein
MATDRVADCTGLFVLTGLKVLKRRIGPPMSKRMKRVSVTPIRPFMYHLISEPSSFAM